MSGGNDYKLAADDVNIKNSFLRKDIWAYSDGKKLYLNCLKLNLQPWYTDVAGDGRYMYFYASMSTQTGLKKKQAEIATIGYAFGGIAAGIASTKAAVLRFLYALDKESGELIAIDARTMNDLLASAPKLQDEFAQEPNRMYEETHVKYLKRLNEFLKEQTVIPNENNEL